MKTVGSRELKNRLGRYLRLVRRGETILVTDRGKPVAHIVPPEPGSETKSELDAILGLLQSQGHLRIGSGQFKPFKPVAKKGKLASRIILEERD